MATLTIGKNSARRKQQNAYNTQESAAGDSVYSEVQANTVRLGDYGNYPIADESDPEGARYVGVASQWDFDKSYHPGFWDVPGLPPDPQTVLYSKPGSANLVQPRDTGGIPGTNRLVRSVGPVIGPTQEWTGNNTEAPMFIPGAAGPVGYSDYSAQLAASFAAANRNIYDQAMATAQLVAAV